MFSHDFYIPLFYYIWARKYLLKDENAPKIDLFLLSKHFLPSTLTLLLRSPLMMLTSFPD